MMFKIQISIMNMNKNIQQKQRLPKYHPFQIPPNLQICFKHRICSQFGRIAKLQEIQCCPCCNQPPKQMLKMGCKVSQIYQISEPVGYYFTYIKLVTLALVTIMLITGVYTLIQIINQCSSSESQQDQCIFVYGIPIPKIRVFLKEILFILNSFVIIALYIFACYLIFRYAYLHQKNVCGHQKPSDYSVMLSGFDHDIAKLQHLKQILEEYDVRDIVLTHKIQKYLKWLRKKSILDVRLQKCWQKKQLKKVEKIEQEIKQLQNKMLHVKNMLTLGHDSEFRTDKIIISFEQVHYKKTFEQIYSLTLAKNIYHTFCGGSPLMINDCPIFIEPLGEPNQIIWENLQVTSKQRYLRIFISNLCAALFLCGSFLMIVYLSKSQESRSEVGDALMSLVFAILIQLVNEVFTFAIEVFTKWEGRYTMTGQISIKLYKNIAAFFLNSTLLPFMLFVFDLFHPQQDDIVRNIFSIFLISNLISPYVGSYLNVKYLYKLYQRRKIKKQESECMETQVRANQIFQKIDFMLDEKYALVAQLLMNCMFYAAIFPIGILITIMGMFVTYWSSKWWIINYCSIPKFSFRLGRHMNILSCLFPTIYSFGYAANLYMAKNQAQFEKAYSIYMAAATIPISLLLILFGQRIARRWILKHRESVIECANKQGYFATYKSLNPTSFIHDNLGVDSSHEKPQDMWSKLVSYASAVQSGLLDINDARSSYNSKLNQSIQS